MNSFVSWQLLLFLCATSFWETTERVAPAKDPRSTGTRLGPVALQDPGEQRCAEKKPGPALLRPREASWCSPAEGPAGPQRPGLCAPRSRLTPSPRGAVLVQREKDLSAYNWNSFGLRYGKRQMAPPGWRGRGAGRG
ncbi:metastasis-suppressor KiSS-1 [Orycteropus afer afer]|uniref:Metastasis-suppressor KiSS-1 n=1 Tax=Orycteropus afer afer TaxID=1230840 RepID=A0A8B7B216_ORYAF|nr:metastasis-suppressor KiSS-1 [Orycteropus afer afer]